MISRRPIAFLIFVMGFLIAAESAWAQSDTSVPLTSAQGGSAPPASGQNAFSGSVPAKLVPGVLPLSLQEAIDRGLKQNLGLLLSGEDVRTARGERWKQLSALLPNITTSSYIQDSQVDLAEFGFSFKFPPSTGINIPSVVGPFSYFDSRAYVTQSIFDWKAINNKREATERVNAAQYTQKDARDLVVLAVGYTYLQAIANESRVETANAQQQTAQALFDQASDQVKAGTSPAIDGLRAQVELKTRQQQAIQAKNDFAIQKLALARVIGLAPGQVFELTDKAPYSDFAGISVEDALKRAYDSRSDFQAAAMDVRAAQYSRKAAEGEYFPTLSFSGDYGLAGTLPNVTTHGVFDVRGTLAIPIFQGGKVHGDMLQADARLEQSRERLENLRAQIDTDVRTALLNLESAEEQVTVATSNIDLAGQALAQSRDRFVAGVTDTVEVVQAQEAVASANERYISSLYSYNYSKISLARAIGLAEISVKDYFKGK